MLPLLPPWWGASCIPNDDHHDSGMMPRLLLCPSVYSPLVPPPFNLRICLLRAIELLLTLLLPKMMGMREGKRRYHSFTAGLLIIDQ